MSPTLISPRHVVSRATSSSREAPAAADVPRRSLLLSSLAAAGAAAATSLLAAPLPAAAADPVTDFLRGYTRPEVGLQEAVVILMDARSTLKEIEVGSPGHAALAAPALVGSFMDTCMLALQLSASGILVLVICCGRIGRRTTGSRAPHAVYGTGHKPRTHSPDPFPQALAATPEDSEERFRARALWPSFAKRLRAVAEAAPVAVAAVTGAADKEETLGEMYGGKAGGAGVSATLQ